jgi:hypothetical protein
MKVSVIVSLYNSGDKLFDLVESLDRQTMPASDFEVLLIDDESTDDTLAVARGLAESRPNMTVETIPHAGWPGRPRNTGLDRAVGDYVFFADHDDVFAPRALERMHAMAVANSADIVYGKIVRRGRATPYWTLWQQDVDVADPASDVVTSRTVHKLYRRAFLAEHNVRFHEGKVRVEDHLFMAHAVPHADVMSVLASESCYVWIYREAEEHISSSRVSDRVYWQDFARVMDVWTEQSRPGPALDAAITAMARGALTRFRPRPFLTATPQRQTTRLTALHEALRDRFPARLDSTVPVVERLQLQAVRAGDLEQFRAALELSESLSIQLRTTVGAASADRRRLTVTVSLDRADELVEATATGAVLRAPAGLVAADAARRLTTSDFGGAELSVRHRRTGLEWPVPCTVTSSGTDLVMTVTADVDLARNAFGAPLLAGTWDVLLRWQFLGRRGQRRVPVPHSLAGLGRARPLQMTKDRTLALTVEEDAADAANGVTALTWEGPRLHVSLAPNGPRRVGYGVRGEDAELRWLWRDGAVATVDIATVAGDDIVDFWVHDELGAPVRLRYNGPAVRQAQLMAYSTTGGALSVRRQQRSPAQRGWAAVRRLARGSA